MRANDNTKPTGSGHITRTYLGHSKYPDNSVYTNAHTQDRNIDIEERARVPLHLVIFLGMAHR
jgi:hypothetical protein